MHILYNYVYYILFILYHYIPILYNYAYYTIYYKALSQGAADLLPECLEEVDAVDEEDHTLTCNGSVE